MRAKKVQHGHSVGGKLSRTYTTWAQMKQRCNNPNKPEYKYYGGRGITVCAEWNDFASFLRDMGERPAGTELERIDNDAGYCLENCRWATHEENSRNRRPVKLNEEAIKVIRYCYRNCATPVRLLASLHSVSPGYVYHLVSGIKWRDDADTATRETLPTIRSGKRSHRLGGRGYGYESRGKLTS